MILNLGFNSKASSLHFYFSCEQTLLANRELANSFLFPSWQHLYCSLFQCSVLFSTGDWVTETHGLQTRACGLWKSVQLPECTTGGTCFCLSVAGTKGHLCGWQAEVRNPCVLAQVSELSCNCCLCANEYEPSSVGSISSHITLFIPMRNVLLFQPKHGQTVLPNGSVFLRQADHCDNSSLSVA